MKTKDQIKDLEIMAPAGNYESLNAAIKAGANSIYFGVGNINMRAGSARNFTLDDLKDVADLCKKNKVKTYLTVNIVLYDNDIEEMKRVIDAAKKAGITAIIAADIAAIQYANEIGVEVHISTQANVSNYQAVKFYSKFADVIVLARELTLDQIKTIISNIKKDNLKGPSGELLKIEVFAHGALCVSISGKCYMSLAQYNSSANRGKCLQVCRRSYRVIDEETGDELVIDNKYVMSPKDLCTIEFLDKLIDAGVEVFKIEGRGRSVDYVYTTVKCYRDACDAFLENKFTKQKINTWHKKLESVFNRGFWHGGYYMRIKLGEWAGTYGSKTTTQKITIGKVINYYPKANVAEILIQTNELNKNDNIIITGPTTGIVYSKAEKIILDEKEIEKAEKSQSVTLKINEKVRKNDKVFVVKEK